jgi:hypothetical protein
MNFHTQSLNSIAEGKKPGDTGQGHAHGAAAGVHGHSHGGPRLKPGEVIHTVDAKRLMSRAKPEWVTLTFAFLGA